MHGLIAEPLLDEARLATGLTSLKPSSNVRLRINCGKCHQQLSLCILYYYAYCNQIITIL